MSKKILKKAKENAAELVLLISKQIIQNQYVSAIEKIVKNENIDYQRFKEYIIYHDLITFAYASLKEHFNYLPVELAVFLKNNYYANILRYQYLEQEFFKINDACRKKMIVFVPIKGMGLFSYYDNPSLRQMSDIDILVKEKDFSVITDIFYDLGYAKDLMNSSEAYWKQKQCHITFSRNEEKFKILADVHWLLDFKRHSQRELPGLWDRVKQVTHQERHLHLLSDEDAFLALALHNRRFGKSLCLKNICDNALILKCSKNFNWNYITAESNKSQFCATVIYTLYQLQLLLKVEINKNIFKDLKIPFWKQKLMQGFIHRNSFLAGQKHRRRELYLKSHFLLYDGFFEALDYIAKIPIEQFAKFYRLKQENRITRLYYRLRWLYMPIGYLGMKLTRNKELENEYKTGLSR